MADGGEQEVDQISIGLVVDTKGAEAALSAFEQKVAALERRLQALSTGLEGASAPQGEVRQTGQGDDAPRRTRATATTASDGGRSRSAVDIQVDAKNVAASIRDALKGEVFDINVKIANLAALQEQLDGHVFNINVRMAGAQAATPQSSAALPPSAQIAASPAAPQAAPQPPHVQRVREPSGVPPRLREAIRVGRAAASEQEGGLDPAELFTEINRIVGTDIKFNLREPRRSNDQTEYNTSIARGVHQMLGAIGYQPGAAKPWESVKGKVVRRFQSKARESGANVENARASAIDLLSVARPLLEPIIRAYTPDVAQEMAAPPPTPAERINAAPVSPQPAVHAATPAAMHRTVENRETARTTADSVLRGMQSGEPLRLSAVSDPTVMAAIIEPYRLSVAERERRGAVEVERLNADMAARAEAAERERPDAEPQPAALRRARAQLSMATSSKPEETPATPRRPKGQRVTAVTPEAPPSERPTGATPIAPLSAEDALEARRKRQKAVRDQTRTPLPGRPTRQAKGRSHGVGVTPEGVIVDPMPPKSAGRGGEQLGYEDKFIGAIQKMINADAFEAQGLVKEGPMAGELVTLPKFPIATYDRNAQDIGGRPVLSMRPKKNSGIQRKAPLPIAGGSLPGGKNPMVEAIGEADAIRMYIGRIVDEQMVGATEAQRTAAKEAFEPQFNTIDETQAGVAGEGEGVIARTLRLRRKQRHARPISTGQDIQSFPGGGQSASLENLARERVAASRAARQEPPEMQALGVSPVSFDYQAMLKVIGPEGTPEDMEAYMAEWSGENAATAEQVRESGEASRTRVAEEDYGGVAPIREGMPRDYSTPAELGINTIVPEHQVAQVAKAQLSAEQAGSVTPQGNTEWMEIERIFDLYKRQGLPLVAEKSVGRFTAGEALNTDATGAFPINGIATTQIEYMVQAMLGGEGGLYERMGMGKMPVTLGGLLDTLKSSTSEKGTVLRSHVLPGLQALLGESGLSEETAKRIQITQGGVDKRNEDLRGAKMLGREGVIRKARTRKNAEVVSVAPLQLKSELDLLQQTIDEENVGGVGGVPSPAWRLAQLEKNLSIARGEVSAQDLAEQRGPQAVAAPSRTGRPGAAPVNVSLEQRKLSGAALASYEAKQKPIIEGERNKVKAAETRIAELTRLQNTVYTKADRLIAERGILANLSPEDITDTVMDDPDIPDEMRAPVIQQMESAIGTKRGRLPLHQAFGVRSRRRKNRAKEIQEVRDKARQSFTEEEGRNRFTGDVAEEDQWEPVDDPSDRTWIVPKVPKTETGAPGSRAVNDVDATRRKVAAETGRWDYDEVYPQGREESFSSIDTMRAGYREEAIGIAREYGRGGDALGPLPGNIVVIGNVPLPVQIVQGGENIQTGQPWAGPGSGGPPRPPNGGPPRLTAEKPDEDPIDKAAKELAESNAYQQRQLEAQSQALNEGEATTLAKLGKGFRNPQADPAKYPVSNWTLSRIGGAGPLDMAPSNFGWGTPVGEDPVASRAAIKRTKSAHLDEEKLRTTREARRQEKYQELGQEKSLYDAVEAQYRGGLKPRAAAAGLPEYPAAEPLLPWMEDELHAGWTGRAKLVKGEATSRNREAAAATRQQREAENAQKVADRAAKDAAKAAAVPGDVGYSHVEAYRDIEEKVAARDERERKSEIKSLNRQAEKISRQERKPTSREAVNQRLITQGLPPGIPGLPERELTAEAYESKASAAVMREVRGEVRAARGRVPQRALGTSMIQLAENTLGNANEVNERLALVEQRYATLGTMGRDLSRMEGQFVEGEKETAGRQESLVQSKTDLRKSHGRVRQFREERLVAEGAGDTVAAQKAGIRESAAMVEWQKHRKAIEDDRIGLREHQKDQNSLSRSIAVVKGTMKEYGDETKRLAKSAVGATDVLRNLGAGFIGGIGGGLVTMAVSTAVQGAIGAVTHLLIPQLDKAMGSGMVAQRTQISLAEQYAQGGYGQSAYGRAYAQAGFRPEEMDRFAAVLNPQATQIANAAQLQQRLDLYRTYDATQNQAREMGLPPGVSPSMYRGSGALLSFGTPWGSQVDIGGTDSTAKMVASIMSQAIQSPDQEALRLSNAMGSGVADLDKMIASTRSEGWYQGLSDTDKQVYEAEWAANRAQLEGEYFTKNPEARIGLSAADRKRMDERLNAPLERAGSSMRVRELRPGEERSPELEETLMALGGGAVDILNSLKETNSTIDNANNAAEVSRFVDIEGTAKVPMTSLAKILTESPQFSNNMWLMEQQRQVALQGVSAQNALTGMAQPLTAYGTGIAYRAGGPGPSAQYAGAAEALDMQIAAEEAAGYQELLTTFNMPQDLLTDYAQLGRQTKTLNEELGEIQRTQTMRNFGISVTQASYQLADLAGLVGESGASNIGMLERENLLMGRRLQLLQFEQQQRSINFGIATAGFQSIGLTGEERAANIRIAKKEAALKQSQLDIGQGMFGNQIQIIDQSNMRQFQMAARQMDNMLKTFDENSRVGEINQTIARLSRRQSQIEGKVATTLDAEKQLISTRVKYLADLATEANVRLEAAGLIDTSSTHLKTSTKNIKEAIEMMAGFIEGTTSSDGGKHKKGTIGSFAADLQKQVSVVVNVAGNVTTQKNLVDTIVKEVGRTYYLGGGS